jgi:hypothetical protein
LNLLQISIGSCSSLQPIANPACSGIAIWSSRWMAPSPHLTMGISRLCMVMYELVNRSWRCILGMRLYTSTISGCRCVNEQEKYVLSKSNLLSLNPGLRSLEC